MAHSLNYCCLEKITIIKHLSVSVWVRECTCVRVRIALLLQHATGMLHILSSLFWPLHHVF